MRAIVPIGRALFSLAFISSVFGQFSGAAIESASAHGVPLAPIVVPASGLLALIGGLSVLLGYRARFGAFLLLLFLVPGTLIMHPFWGIADPRLAAAQRALFLDHTALAGGALLLIYHGSGPVSLDG